MNDTQDDSIRTSRQIKRKDFRELKDQNSWQSIIPHCHEHIARILKAESHKPRSFKINTEQATLKSIEVVYNSSSPDKKFYWWMKVNNTEKLEVEIYTIRGNYYSLMKKLRKTEKLKTKN